MTRRDLGLLIAPEPPPGVAMLARLLDRWCVPTAADPRHDSPAAWLASSPRAAGLDDALATGVPVAVWISAAEDIVMLGDRARVVLVSDAASAVEGHDAMVVGGAIDVQRFAYVSPFVRGRWRAARGLPATMVAVIDSDGDVDDDTAPTTLALASAVAVSGPRLLEALAWGAPCATDAESAAMAGAADGREVVVAEPDRLRAAAAVIAADPVLAATLSRAGRRLVERRHDRGRTPLALARRLGLVGSTAAGRIDEALDELWTPTRARIRERAQDSLVGLVTP